VIDEQAFQINQEPQQGGRGEDQGTYHGRGRGRFEFYKFGIKCYNCHDL